MARQTETATDIDPPPLPDDSAAAAFPVQRDFAGRVAQWQAYQGCRRQFGHGHTGDAAQCVRPGLSDPVSLAPMVLVPACLLLIVSGALTAKGRGPGALITTHSRRHSARLQVLRRRRWIGAALVLAGLISFAILFWRGGSA